ncbi:hypothetical protein EDD86DRAFT_207346 [Gorgonomyces haynaldii]|nr:hypothetical protein EDD86DRAFT_207346 [Gorgonomyces haynaldii]
MLTDLVNTQFIVAFSLCLVVSLTAFVRSTFTGNYSFVDRIWSITPWLYCWIFASGSMDVRTVTMAVLSTLWGLRLTFNFWRRGGYNQGEQDYRWPELQKIITSKPLWMLFNLLFISLYQNILLFLITVSVYVSSLSPNVPWMWTDSLFMGLFVFLLCGETLADQQQFDFQSRKYELIAEHGSIDKIPHPYNVGFVQSGLWRFSRHPNFFCEQSLWWCLYGMSLGPSIYGTIPVASGIGYGIIGPFLLSLLFLGSTAFTEWITARKYPLYKVYQKRFWTFLGPPGKEITIADLPGSSENLNQ